MTDLPIGTFVTCQDDAQALVWERLGEHLLGMPIRRLNRPRRRSDVLLDVGEYSTLFGASTRLGGMYVDTAQRMLVHDDCAVHREAGFALLSRIRLTMQRCREADAMERAAALP